jgi:hypothetical protein
MYLISTEAYSESSSIDSTYGMMDVNYNAMLICEPF